MKIIDLLVTAVLLGLVASLVVWQARKPERWLRRADGVARTYDIALTPSWLPESPGACVPSIC